MTAILAFDLAENVGFAFWRPGANRVYSGSFRLPETGSDVGWYLTVFEKKAKELLTFHTPDLCVFEAPWVGPKTHQDTARKLLCLAGFTEFLCRKAGADYREAHNQSVKKHFLGRGNLPSKQAKRLCVEKCRELGWSPSNHDEADALAVLSYAFHLRKIEVPWSVGGLFQAEAAQ